MLLQRGQAGYREEKSNSKPDYINNFEGEGNLPVKAAPRTRCNEPCPCGKWEKVQKMLFE